MYSNKISSSFPNDAFVGAGFQSVTLQDIDPKKNKISIHVILVMVWYENRIELLNLDVSSYFGGDDAEAIWRPKYSINR